MRQLLTRRQRDFLAVAERLTGPFAERAAAHDEANTFPRENFDDLRDAGLLRLSIPIELGGMGATLAEILPVLERLAAADGSTALAAAAHISPLGQWGAVWRRTGDPRLERLLREAAEGRLVWASVTGEPDAPDLLTDARTRAERAEGGYRLTGRKTLAISTGIATHCSTTARYEDPDLGPRLMLFRVALTSPGLTVLPTWDALGMRGAQSNDVELDGVFVPDDALVHSLPVGHFDATVLQTVFAWAMPAFGAVYNGVALGALEYVTGHVVRRGATGDVRVRDAVAECEALLESSRALLYRHADEVLGGLLAQGLSVQEGFARCALVRRACTANAIAVVQRLAGVLGGEGFTRAAPFERMWRDVQAGRFLPFDDRSAAELIGATALGVPLAPEIGADESGPRSRPKRPVPRSAGDGHGTGVAGDGRAPGGAGTDQPAP
ncbi:acyl-CoA dehydrogenase family protein [Actinomadura fibrosa]|uniref:Dibenzothiophene monooxygenase n=1 Tax=Actinomadura fibrosa TaxID=111802 RepID=A0ABW2XLZ6_9ACTN|nr:acyl-CoA dehydrogenase family protein [Actinomadura fibrosa]